MATDDDEWLYGSQNAREHKVNPSNQDPPKEEPDAESTAQPEASTPTSDAEPQEVPDVDVCPEHECVDAPGADDEDSEDDDDQVNIVIDQDKIDESENSYQTFGLVKSLSGIRPINASADKKGRFAVEDFENVGKINGVPAYDVDPEMLDDKPWRTPGADITDFFNYGFTECTWQAYIMRQRQMHQVLGLPTPKIAGFNNYKNGPPPPLPRQQPFSFPDGSEALAPPGESDFSHQLMGGPPQFNNGGSNHILSDMDFSVPPPSLNSEIPPSSLLGEDQFRQEQPLTADYEPTQESQWSAPPDTVVEMLAPQHAGDIAPPGVDTSEPLGDLRKSIKSEHSRRSRDEDRSRSSYESSYRSSRRRYSRSRSPRDSRYYRDRDRRSDYRRSDRRSRSRSPSSRHKKSKRDRKDRESRRDEDSSD